MVKIIFKSGTEEISVNAEVGSSLLEVAKDNGIKLFGGCDGAGVCGTCHVYIDEEFISKVNEASPSEEDIIDVLLNGKINSRLACQIIVTEQLDGLTVTIPQ